MIALEMQASPVAFGFRGSLMLSVWGQAMNAWDYVRPHQERDLVLAQLHSYGPEGGEYVGIYEVTAGKMQQREKVGDGSIWIDIRSYGIV